MAWASERAGRDRGRKTEACTLWFGQALPWSSSDCQVKHQQLDQELAAQEGEVALEWLVVHVGV